LRSVILVVLFVLTALALLGIFPEEAFAVIPPTPTVISPSSGEAIVLSSANDPVNGFPSFIVDVEVEDTDFNIDMVFVFSNPATGDETIRANLGGPSKQFDLIQEPQSLASILNFDPQTGSFNLEVFSTTLFGSPNAENSPSVFITDLSYAPPPPPIVSSPTSNEVIVDTPTFTVEVDIVPSLIPDDIDVVFTFINPDTGDSRVSSKKSPNVDGSWDETFPTNTIAFVIGVAPGEEFILDVFVKIETLFFLESEHVVIDGLTFFLDGCPLPNNNVNEVFGGFDNPAFSIFEPQMAFAVGEPTAMITGPMTGKHNMPVTLDGSMSVDKDGNAVNCFQWELDTPKPAGTMVMVQSATSSVMFTPDVPGNYIIKLTVTDSQGVKGSTTHTVMVPNERPIADIQFSSAGPPGSSPQPGIAINLDGTGSMDPDGTIQEHFWFLFDSPVLSGLKGNSIQPSLAPMTSFTPDVAGTYVVSLDVKDNLGANTQLMVTIKVGNQSPTASPTATPNPQSINKPVQLDAVADDPDGDNNKITYKWVVKDPDDATIMLADDTISNPSFIPTEKGMYTALVTVTDVDGASINPMPPLMIMATAGNAPTLTITSPADGSSFEERQTIRIDATADDQGEDGNITDEIMWSIPALQGSKTQKSDGPVPFDLSVFSAGTYQIIFTVTDSDDNKVTETRTITITPRFGGTQQLPAGMDVKATQPVGKNNIKSIDFEFDNVPQDQEVETTLSGKDLQPPRGFRVEGLGEEPFFIDFQTSVGVTGNVDIKINYDGTKVTDSKANSLTIFREDPAVPGKWDEIKPNVDTTKKSISFTTPGFSIFFIGSPIQTIGGELIPLDTTMILVAGTQTTAAWMIPVLVSAIGIGIVIARKF